MAVIVVSASQPTATVPFAAIPTSTRLPGATSTSVTLDVDGSAATIILGGTGLTYDDQALPSGGTISSITFLADGVTTSWTVSGFTIDAALLRANAGALDTLLFGGDDSITGGVLGDLLAGYGGSDTIAGGSGNDTLLGADGNDSLAGGSGIDSLVGGGGNDTYAFGSGDIVVEASGGGTDLVVASSSVTLAAQVENLLLTGSFNVNGTGNTLGNVMTGNGGKNALSGSGGNDTLAGGAGADTLTGGAGADRLVGGADDDLYVIDLFDTVIENAGEGVDTVRSAGSVGLLAAEVEVLQLTGAVNVNGRGNALANLILGNDGANSLRGGAGNDTLVAGQGLDTLLGEGDDDVIRIDGAANQGVKYVDGGSGLDTLYASDLVGSTVLNVETLAWGRNDGSVSLTSAQLAAFAGIAIQNGAPETAQLDVSGGGTIDLGALTYDLVAGQKLEVYAPTAAAYSISGRDLADGFADDWVYVLGGADSIVTFGGNDIIFAPGGSDTIDAGAGDDEIFIGEAGLSRVIAGDGNDTVNLFSQGATPDGAKTIDGGLGNDRITSGGGRDSLLGDSGADTISGEGGIDTINGGTGNDSILGGADGDRLIGGVGADTLVGGTGADTFVYDDGHSGVPRSGILTLVDTILDFSRLQGDRIDLRQVDANTALLLDQAFSAPVQATVGMTIGTGSLVYTVGASATTISGSTDADSDFEFRIIVQVAGYTPIASDFLL